MEAETRSRTDRLAEMIADLDGYIDRRAGLLAAGRIAEAEDAATARVAAVVAEANEKLGECQAGRQRSEDVLAELRRRMSGLERQAEQAREARNRLASIFGQSPALVPLADLLAMTEAALGYRKKNVTDA